MTSKDLDHLRPKTRQWVRQICQEYILESHQERLLLVAASSWDRLLQAREEIEAKGLSYEDARGVRRANPAIKIEADSQVRFMRAVRELDIQVAEPGKMYRPPALRSNRPLTAIKGGRGAA